MEKTYRTDAEWKKTHERIQKKVEGGMTITSACKELGVPDGSYMNYRTRLRKSEGSAEDFQKFASKKGKFVPAKTVGKKIVIKVGSGVIEIDAADKETLSIVLEALK